MKIDYLKNHPEFILEISNCLYNEFIDKTKISKSEMIKIVKNRCNENKLPITLIAYESRNLIGTVSLFNNDLEGFESFKPWLAALYVKNEYRKNNVGKTLVNEIINLSKKLNYNFIYLRTENKVSYYKKMNWTLLEKSNDDIPTNIMMYSLK